MLVLGLFTISVDSAAEMQQPSSRSRYFGLCLMRLSHLKERRRLSRNGRVFACSQYRCQQIVHDQQQWLHFNLELCFMKIIMLYFFPSKLFSLHFLNKTRLQQNAFVSPKDNLWFPY